nr:MULTISPECIES: transposase [Bradyrhizobium]
MSQVIRPDRIGGPLHHSATAKRNQVERFFNRIKQCRRVATRYDRLAGNYLVLVQLASIRLWLAARYESTP